MHFVNNRYGGACDDPRNRNSETGITKLGEFLIEECNQNNIWIDLSHMTDKTAERAVEISNNPVITHIGFRELNNKKRNQTTELFHKIKNKNGMIGLTPWSHLTGNDEIHYIEQFKYAISKNLDDIVGIGSDFGAPIWTHKKHRNLIDLSKSIREHLPQHADKFINQNLLSQLQKILN